MENEELELKILYIEDDEFVRGSISRVLGLISKNVISVANAVEALEYIQNNEVDLIVTDIRMPKINGLEFVEKIQNEGYDIPVIITSAFNDLDYLNQALELKVEKFLKKPINIDSLIETITKIAHVIADQRELKKKKLQLENYKRAVLLTNLVIEMKTDGEFVHISNTLKEFILKYSNENIVFDNFENFGKYYDYVDIYNNTKDQIRKEMFEKIFKLQVFSRDIFLTINNNSFTFNMTVFASSFIGNEVDEITIILKDLTSAFKSKDEQINELYHDPLTNLPNKYALIKNLNNKDKDLALTLISLDEFKKLRNTYGFSTVDKIVSEVSKELEGIWLNEKYENRRVYKLENELFAITRDKDECENTNILKGQFPDDTDFQIFISKKIANDFIEHFEKYVVDIGELHIDISVTLGGSCDGSTDLLQEALIALDNAIVMKKDFVCFKELQNPKEIYKKNILMQHKIKRAMDNDKIVAFFQPIVNINKEVVKYEALARIIDSDDNNTILTPYHFLDIVKDSKNYGKFTKTIIKKSIEGSLVLKSPVSVNLSFDDISNPEIIEFLEDILKSNPYQITLEFLESEGVQDLEKTKEFCRRMKSYGAKIAIDDFGSGYSNYDYFLEIPLDVLKLDGSLIKKANDYKGYLLLESIIKFAKILDIEIVAEFIENKEYFNILSGLGVDQFQGYYFGRPKSISDYQG